MRKALVIGIDSYQNTSPLNGCVNDAVEIAQLLERHGDGSPNFSVRRLTSADSDVSSEAIQHAIYELFTGDAETALLYFAGHGLIDPTTNAGFIVASDGRRGAWGMSLADILGLANRGHPRIRSSVIILDSCNSGFTGEIRGLGNEHVSAIGSGVTILTSCHRDGFAEEGSRHGLFTDIIIDGLGGGSSDICGNITPASLYSHVDQTLGPWEQRPIYKANVQTFVTLRQVTPKIPLEVLRNLPEYFQDAAYVFPLDPSYEPDRVNVPHSLRHTPVDPEHNRIFKELQQCNRHGLVVPVDADHMYYAAIHSTGCKLTALGAHYRKLAEMKRL